MKKNILCMTLLISLMSLTRAYSENGDDKAIKSCLDHWGKHPFGSALPKYRVLSTKVRVLGIGGSVADTHETSAPELVLVKPNVSVLSKTELQLLNPNGWYCLKGKVSVLGKTVVNLHCKGNLASSSDGATVLGGNDIEGGTNVLGTSRVKRIGCLDKK